MIEDKHLWRKFHLPSVDTRRRSIQELPGMQSSSLTTHILWPPRIILCVLLFIPALSTPSPLLKLRLHIVSSIPDLHISCSSLFITIPLKDPLHFLGFAQFVTLHSFPDIQLHLDLHVPTALAFPNFSPHTIFFKSMPITGNTWNVLYGAVSTLSSLSSQLAKRIPLWYSLFFFFCMFYTAVTSSTF